MRGVGEVEDAYSSVACGEAVVGTGAVCVYYLCERGDVELFSGFSIF